MKVGDLIKEKDLPEIGLIVKIHPDSRVEAYGILCPDGKVEFFSKHYVKNMCEVVNASR